MMMMTSIPGYNLPALPASNYNYGARPATTTAPATNPEYSNAWKTATTVPTSTTAYGYTAPTNNSASQTNNTTSNSGQYYSPADNRSYTDNSKYAYTAPTNNSASQTNNTYSSVDNKLNKTYSPTDNRSYTDNSKYAYAYTAPTNTTNNTDNSQKTATQNTTYNSELNQYLKQIDNRQDNRQLNQTQYTQNTANTANINNNLLAYYNPITNTYQFPQLPPQQPPVVVPPTTVTPEAPKQGGGEFPWLLVGAGLLGVGAFTNWFGLGGNKGETKAPEAKPTAPVTETPIETPKSPKSPTKPTAPKAKPAVLNQYKMHKDPFVSINGGKDVQHIAGIKHKGGTANVDLGTTNKGTKVSSTYVRSHVDGKHGAMESMKDLAFHFADGSDISVSTSKKGTTLKIGDKQVNIKEHGTYEVGEQTVKVANGSAVITSKHTQESFTVYLGEYKAHENKTKLGPNFLQLSAMVEDFDSGVFDSMEGKAGNLKPAHPTERNITAETTTIAATEDAADSSDEG